MAITIADTAPAAWGCSRRAIDEFASNVVSACSSSSGIRGVLPGLGCRQSDIVRPDYGENGSQRPIFSVRHRDVAAPKRDYSAHSLRHAIVRKEAKVSTTETEPIARVKPRGESNNVTAVLSAVEMPNEAGFARAGWETRYVRLIIALEFLVGAAAGLIALVVRFGDALDAAYNRDYLWITIAFPFGWVAALAVNRAFETRFLFVGSDEYERIFRAGIGLTAVSVFISFAVNLHLSRGYPLIAMPAVVLMSMFVRYVVRQALHRAWGTGRRLRRVILAGHEQSVWELTRKLRRERFHGMGVVGVCLPRSPVLASAMLPEGQIRPPVFGDLRVEQIAHAVAKAKADTVILLPCPELGSSAIRRLAWMLERDDIDLILASALLDIAGDRTTIRPVDGLPLLHVEHARLKGGRRMVKEVFDRVVGLAGLMLLMPLVIVVAALVKLTRGGQGPMIFRQTRVGRNGKPFVIYKFRTMYEDAEARLSNLEHLNENDGILFKMRFDPRVTPIGRMLRRYSIDEIPQLLNVIKGDMSLVGPRPPLPREVAEYPFDVRRRLVVKPGVTGLWQVSGRSDLSWEESVGLDLRYVENWSLPMDLIILARTILAVFRSSGAY
jgi:exopolysaccharide biosynthesis polyprenyl glycosylphosphotransferase